jgi:hypothetical protein
VLCDIEPDSPQALDAAAVGRRFKSRVQHEKSPLNTRFA